MYRPEQLQQLVDRQSMSRTESRSLMRDMTGTCMSDAQIGAILTALRMKGCTGEELAGFADSLREQARAVVPSVQATLDTCGTGGGRPTFNISTAAAFVVAAAGIPVAKHGNRAVSSLCGSADVLEAMGAQIEVPARGLEQMLAQIGIAFLFAPAFHPAMRRVGSIRRELGIRTVFNQIGPLANPAGATRQIVGVYDSSLMRPMIDALLALGADHAYVVHGEDGIDEVSPCAPTKFYRVHQGRVDPGTFHPEQFGIKDLSYAALAPGISPEENAAILKEALTNVKSDRFQAIVPSSALGLVVGSVASDVGEASEIVRQIVHSGAAARKLEGYVMMSRRFGGATS